MSLCGALKQVNGRCTPLVCNQPIDHPGPHGIGYKGLPPYVRWVQA